MKDMSRQSSARGKSAGESDDSYWMSLFELEETVFGAPSAPDADPSIEREPVLHEPVSASEVQSPDPWHLAENLMESDQVLELKVHGYNKGGLLVFWRGIQGFVPASQLIDFPQFHLQRERMQALADWKDRTLKVKIIDVNRAKNRLVFSERYTLVAADERSDLLQRIKPGEIVTGEISNLTKFGAFVDLGGVEGLVHISEISWARITETGTVLKPRQKVRALVLDVDPLEGRVALSIKRLSRDPWETAGERYQPGELVRGTISNIATFGAFVILEEQLEGLVHISELAEGMFLHPRDVVKIGDKVVARVLYVDPPNKRLALSMRGVNGVVEPGP